MCRTPYSVFHMHRRKDLWGPDGTSKSFIQITTNLFVVALEFDPDRWLDHRLHKYLTPNPFIFLPFNAGPRICLGQQVCFPLQSFVDHNSHTFYQFAYNEVSFFLTRFLQNFSSVSLAPDAQPPSSRPPAEWAGAPGRKGIEKIVAKSHLTLYALVSVLVIFFCIGNSTAFFTGGFVGASRGGGECRNSLRAQNHDISSRNGISMNILIIIYLFEGLQIRSMIMICLFRSRL